MKLAAIMRLALRTRWLRGMLVALLLVAQHGALTHALAHAGRSAHADASALHTADSRPVGGAPADVATEMCADDLVYSQVLGGVHAGMVVIPGAAGQALRFSAVPSIRRGTAVVPYDIRGPPSLS